MQPLNSMRRKDSGLQWLTLVLLLLFGILAVGLWYVQIVSFKKYEKYREVQSYRTVRIPAPRGRIYDRYGRLLADNQPKFNVVLYLDQLRDDFRQTYKRFKGDRKLSYKESLKLQKDARYNTVSNLVYEASRLIGEPSILIRRKFEQHYTRNRYVAMPALIGLSREQMARFMEQGSRLRGFDLEVRSTRHYPNGSLASHLLGYMRPRFRQLSENAPTLQMSFDYELPDFKGVAGLERQYQQHLSGEPGAKSILVNNMIYRQEEEEWLPSLPGKNLYLTLDIRIQEAAEKALRHMDPHRKGAVVVMDCLNGDILALASVPGFDPNIFSGPLSSKVYDPMIDPAGPKPLFNRATHGQYLPGSIFKIMVGLAGLQKGVIHPKEQFFGDGYYQLGSRRIADTAGSGYFDFDRAFYRSCNAYFIHFGLEAGPEAILDAGHQIFLGQETGLLPYQETAGNFPTLETLRKGWYPGDTANLSIGQGKIDVTPLQMAVMTAAVANGGRVFWPRVVAGFETIMPALNGLFEAKPEARLRGRLKATQDHLATVQQAMLEDVEHPAGSGAPCRIPGYRIGGKTGTAETEFRINGRKTKHTWFVSYAPFDDPRYAVVVFVDDGISGRTSCAPLARIVYGTLKDLPNPVTIKPIRQTLMRGGYERAL
ncbi:MAG: penicillin-binding protein 2 [Verrucomicrobiota bacterium]|nr:penicillin-binding protein 2 [Verrucomicrobiota bacterium]